MEHIDSSADHGQQKPLRCEEWERSMWKEPWWRLNTVPHRLNPSLNPREEKAPHVHLTHPLDTACA